MPDWDQDLSRRLWQLCPGEAECAAADWGRSPFLLPQLRPELRIRPAHPLTSAACLPAAGLSLGTVQLSCQAGGASKRAQQVARRTGFLFTHKGYSGPAVLDVSHHLVMALERRGSGDAAQSQQQAPVLRANWTGEEAAVWDERLRAGGAALVRNILVKEGMRVRGQRGGGLGVGVGWCGRGGPSPHASHGLLTAGASAPSLLCRHPPWAATPCLWSVLMRAQPSLPCLEWAAASLPSWSGCCPPARPPACVPPRSGWRALCVHTWGWPTARLPS